MTPYTEVNLLLDYFSGMWQECYWPVDTGVDTIFLLMIGKSWTLCHCWEIHAALPQLFHSSNSVSSIALGWSCSASTKNLSWPAALLLVNSYKPKDESKGRSICRKSPRFDYIVFMWGWNCVLMKRVSSSSMMCCCSGLFRLLLPLLNSMIFLSCFSAGKSGA